jgi:ppGpp synthetase/RelA/SpoT-type nucleotidyltranferase
LKDLRSWYNRNESTYKALTQSLKELITKILDKEAVEYVLIEARLKKFESFEMKMVRKGYNNPDQVTDFAGVMIVGSVLSNAELISKVIKRGKEFEIDWDNSQDHSIKLAENRVG